MTPNEELKNLVSQMNSEQFQWFVTQMQHVLSEEVDCKRRVQADVLL